MLAKKILMESTLAISSIDNRRLCGEMVSVLTSSGEGHEFDPRPGQTKDIKISIYCFYA